jgi:hypothetical protein
MMSAGPSRRFYRWIALAGLAVLALSQTALAQVVGPGGDPNEGIRLPLGLSDGVPIQRLYVHLIDDSSKAEERKEWLVKAYGLSGGDSFQQFLSQAGLQSVRSAPWVEGAEVRLYQSELPGELVVALIVRAGDQNPRPADPSNPGSTDKADEKDQDGAEKSPRGFFRDGKSFPVLYEDDRSKYTFILNGALGGFSDTQPWFGHGNRFVAPPYDPGSHVAWGETHLETGLGGISRLGSSHAYLYGAGTYLANTTPFPDVFGEQRPLYGDFERLYGGLLVADRSSDFRFHLSGGRQHFQLNRNLLFGYVRGSANARERGGSYLSSRITYDKTVVGKIRKGDWLLQGFYLDPDELPAGDNETQYLGGQLLYNNNTNLEASVSYVSSPLSRFSYVMPDGARQQREGLWLWNPRVRWSGMFGVDGLWLESEYVRQGNRNFDMDAEAAYAWVGYTAKETPGKPAISYRYAHFSGDNPSTAAYERFDPLQSGGLGDWLQGISMAKVVQNTNLNTHNINLRYWPTNTTELSLDYFKLEADQLNNLGGSRPLANLTDRDLGQEVTLTSRTFVNDNVFLLGVASVGFPGEGVQAALGSSSPWITVQGSLFFNL